MRRHIFSIVLLFLSGAASDIMADATTPAANTENTPVTNTGNNPSVATNKENSPKRDFAGLNFGVGVSLTHDLGSRSRISDAVVDGNNIVRVSKDQNDVARVMGEAHYFFEPKNKGSKGYSFFGLTPADKWGHGPFVALQPGTEEIIEAIGVGWMAGFRQPEKLNDSWNLGIGYVVDPSVKVLADGMEENKPLPAGETKVRFKETSQGGLFLLASFSF